MRTKKTPSQSDGKDGSRKRDGDADRKSGKTNPWNSTLTLGPVDRVKYHGFRADHLRILDPQDPHENALAEAIITHRWFLQLADLAEIAVLRDAVGRDQSPSVTVQDLLCPEAGDLKRGLAECNAPASAAEKRDRWLAIAFDRSDLDKIHKFRKEHERALDRLTKEWSLQRRFKAKIDEEVSS